MTRGLDRLGSPKLQAALVALDPHTGNVLALVGGRDFAQSAFNRASRSRRQPGSAFKPFVFAAALERGLSPVSELRGLDRLPPQGPDEWTPRNVHDDAPDVLTLRAALLESNNRAAALLQQQMGSRPVLRLASNAGLQDLPDVPSLALGTGLVTPLAMTAAFAIFPNGGLAVRTRDITRVRDADGSTALGAADRNRAGRLAAGGLPDGGDARRRRRSRHRARRRGGWASGSRPAARPAPPTTSRTPGSSASRRRWSPACGWASISPSRWRRDAFAARYALPIWADFMQQAARVRPPGRFERPAGLHEETLCALSYRQPVDGCPLYTEYFKDGDQVPEGLCPLHRGTVRQRVVRAVQGWFEDLGRSIRDVFR